MSSGARDINFGPSLHLHLYFVYATSEGSGESPQICALTRALVAGQCAHALRPKTHVLAGSLMYQIIECVTNRVETYFECERYEVVCLGLLCPLAAAKIHK